MFLKRALAYVRALAFFFAERASMLIDHHVCGAFYFFSIVALPFHHYAFRVCVIT